MTNCKHERQIWKGQYKRCLECNEQTDYKDMNLEVKFNHPGFEKQFNNNLEG